MGHSFGDGIIVAALSAAFIAYYYFKHRERQRRLDVIHQERLAAMDKGIPLPELPIDPPPYRRPPDPRVLLILGAILLTLGSGTMIAFWMLDATRAYWPLPLPFSLMGFGLILVHFLAAERAS